jgi:hypothetical protein
MKFNLATACAALSLSVSFGGAALADGRVTATLEAPQSHAKFIAAHAVWNCDGASCVAGEAPDDSAGLSGCKELAKKVGRLSAYAGETKALDEKSLAKCNAVAATPAPIGTASR